MTRIGRFITAAAVVAACLPFGPVAVAGADPNPDLLMLSVEEVGAVSGNTGMVADPARDLRRPGSNRQFDGRYPTACRAMFNQDVAFANAGPFRSVTYTAAANQALTQAAGVYPSGIDAKSALRTLATNLLACSNDGQANLSFGVQVLDPNTVAVCFSQCSTLYRVSGPVLMGVSAERFGDSDRIATVVMGQLVARAKAA